MNKQAPVADKVLHYYYAALAGDMTRKEMEAEVRRILPQTQQSEAEALECPRADDTALLRQALEALEVGRDYAFETAERFHIEMRGYKQQRHDAMDADVKQIDSTIAALRH